MANETLAARYATAVFLLAAEVDATEQIGHDLELMRSALTADREAHEFFVAPVVAREAKDAVLRAAFGGRVHEIALHALLLLVRKRREALLPAIAEQYRKLELRRRGEESLTVVTALELAPAELQALIERLQRTFKKKFDVSVKLNPALIGGVRVTMSDRRIDGTIAGRLEELARSMFAQGN